MIGIGCCARAASGHAAAPPPSSVMNSRGFIQSPRPTARRRALNSSRLQGQSTIGRYGKNHFGKGRFCFDHEARFREGFSTQCLIVRGVAQSPQPRAMWRHALDWITHRPERRERPPINPKRQFLAARLPPPRMRPVINLRRTQHFSAARYESAPNPHLHRTAALGWRRRPVTQVTMVRPFHRGPRLASRPGREVRDVLPLCYYGSIHMLDNCHELVLAVLA